MTPLLKHQHTDLKAIAATGQFYDESLAAFLAEVGEGVDRSTIANWRAGRRGVSLGLLSVILLHADDPSAILNVYARRHGLRVVAEAAAETTSRDLVEQAFDVSATVGQLTHEVRQAVADSRIDETEREALDARIEEAISELQKLRGVLGASKLRAVR